MASSSTTRTPKNTRTFPQTLTPTHPPTHSLRTGFEQQVLIALAAEKQLPLEKAKKEAEANGELQHHTDTTPHSLTHSSSTFTHSPIHPLTLCAQALSSKC